MRREQRSAGSWRGSSLGVWGTSGGMCSGSHGPVELLQWVECDRNHHGRQGDGRKGDGHDRNGAVVRIEARHGRVVRIEARHGRVVRFEVRHGRRGSCERRGSCPCQWKRGPGLRWECNISDDLAIQWQDGTRADDSAGGRGAIRGFRLLKSHGFGQQ